MTFAECYDAGYGDRMTAKEMGVSQYEARCELSRVAVNRSRNERAEQVGFSRLQNGAYQGMLDWQDKAKVSLSDRLPKTVGDKDRLSPKRWEPQPGVALPQASA